MKKYEVNDVITLKASGKKALIVANKSIPYHSPIYHKDFYPEGDYDYIILYDIGEEENNLPIYQGRESIFTHQIEE